jgi:hypothetical protein
VIQLTDDVVTSLAEWLRWQGEFTWLMVLTAFS